jgi:hypothetical protein
MGGSNAKGMRCTTRMLTIYFSEERCSTIVSGDCISNPTWTYNEGIIFPFWLKNNLLKEPSWWMLKLCGVKNCRAYHLTVDMGQPCRGGVMLIISKANLRENDIMINETLVYDLKALRDKLNISIRTLREYIKRGELEVSRYLNIAAQPAMN